MNYLISIVGPTAIGKTTLSIALANYFNTEIISCDSRQFYKEMQIGTAAPNVCELNQAKHHFIHHKSIHENYSCGMFEKDATAYLNSIFKTHKVAIMVGGSGLYVNAVVHGLDDFPDIDPNIRNTLNETLKTKGLLYLQEQLKALDPVAYKNIAIENPHRIIRAIEICIGADKPYSQFLNKNTTTRPFKTISIGLTAPREIIYHRINERVDNMIALGLIDEAKSLYQYKHLNPLNTVGYKELFSFFDNAITLDFAISEIKKNTRRFAKRQLTWFTKNKDTIWFPINYDIQKIIKSCEATISNT